MPLQNSLRLFRLGGAIFISQWCRWQARLRPVKLDRLLGGPFEKASRRSTSLLTAGRMGRVKG